jgi:hypothetical protein
MAKRKKRKAKKGRAAAKDVVGGVALANLLSDTAGKLLRDLAVHAIRDMIDAVRRRDDGATKKEKRDVAADVLRVLADRGPMPLADVVSVVDAGLTPVLQALHVMSELRLATIEPDAQTLRLTASGARTADVVGAGSANL